MAKGKSGKKAQAVPAKAAVTSSRTGYKRKKNSRVDVLGAQLSRIKRKALKEAGFSESTEATAKKA